MQKKKIVYDNLEIVKSDSSSSITVDENGASISSSNFAKNTEENLRKELESILLQVYLEHINRTNKIDISVFEKHVILYKIFYIIY